MELASELLERFPGDLAASPYSLARALDVVRAGATGETRKALDALLGEPTPELEGLELAQAAWLAPGYAPGPALHLHTGPLDAQAVNAWAAEHTHGMIREIVERFDPGEKFALTDAIYFEGRWAHPFEVLGTRPFGDGECTMMSVTGGFEHAGEQAVRLPYGHGDLRFVATLGSLHGLHWRHGEGTVELPRFSTESKLELNDFLTALGLGGAFTPGGDLENLFTGDGAKALSRILQRARVDLDEHGTKAAAVTAVMARAVAYTPPFHIVFDRPFTWAIEHAPSGTPLFVGRVLYPTER